jgi:hypothetical protein
MFAKRPMRLLLRTLLTPIAALVLLTACVSFAVATSGGSYHPPKPAEDVYPCTPDNIGHHDGEDGKGEKDGKGGKGGSEDKSRSASLLTQYFTTTTSGGSHGGGGEGGGDDQCEPECPPTSSASSKTYTTTTSGGSHSGGDECKPECPPGSSASSKTYTTTTSGGSHSGGGDECKCPDGSSASSKTYTTTTSGGSDNCKPVECPEGSVHTSTTGGSHGTDDCKPECPNGSLRSGGKCNPPEVSCGHGSYHPRSLPLTGTVNPGGVNTKSYFEYGTSSSLGSTTAAQSLGNAKTPQSIGAAIDNVVPGAKVYYRLKAVSAGGTTSSAVQSFTVPAEAPSATTGGATSVTKSGATLGGTANPNGSATTAYIEYGKTSSYGTEVATQSLGAGTDDKALSATLAGLTPNTKYYYRAVAINPTGTTLGASGSFTTLPNPPTANTGVASSITRAGAKLGGSGNANGAPTTGYFEYGKTATLGSKSGIVSLGSSSLVLTTSATVAGLTANTKYYFRFVATSDGGTVPGSTVSFTTAK